MNDIAREEYKLAKRIAVHDRYALGAAIQVLLLKLYNGKDTICEKIARYFYVNKAHKINKMQLNTLKQRMVFYAPLLINKGGIPKDILDASEHCCIPTHVNTNLIASSSLHASLKKERGTFIILSFPYDIGLVERLRKLDAPKYDKTTKKWRLLATIRNCEALEDLGFTFDNELSNWYHTFSYKFFKTPDKNLKINKLKHELLSFQKEGIAYVISRNNRALIADEMGLGKTIQGIGWLQYLQEERPALIICPSSLKYNWAKEICTWADNPSVYVLSSSPSTKNKNEIFDDKFLYKKGNKNNIFIIINYNIIPNTYTKEKNASGDEIKVINKYSRWINHLEDLNIKCVVIDEAQYIKNKDSERSLATVEICSTVPNIVALSGTPIENRPIEFYNLLNLLNPYLFHNRFEYAKRYCGAKKTKFGWDFKGKSNLKELHEILTKGMMIRRLKKDVLTELPPKRRIIVDIDINNVREYTSAKEDVVKWFKKKGQLKKAKAAEKAEALAKLNALLQLTLKGKMHNCIEWIHTFLENDEKLVVFATHKSTIDILLKEFGHFKKNKNGIAVDVQGSTPDKVRQEYVELFQKNDRCRLFLGNLKAAGVGLTLTKASNTCHVELGLVPSHHLQAEDRVHRIGQVAESVGAYYLIARGTIEEEIAILLNSKYNTLKLVLDGIDTNDDSFDADDDLLADLATRITM